MSLHVNFSEEEASSEARGGEVIPRGEYYVRITNGELREVRQGKNEGKPYYNLEFTIQEGKYADRKVWTNCMLFGGALFTLSQLMKALGIEVRPGQLEVPTIEEMIGKEMIIVTKVQKASEQYDERTEVSGIKPYTGSVPSAGGGTTAKKSSLLPG